MSCVHIQRLFSLSLVLFFGMVTTAHATGAEITDLTGPVQQIFEALRSPTFVRAVGIGLLAMLLIGMNRGIISGGWVEAMGVVLVLGLWFGAEAIADTIFTTSGVMI
jgi:type IV secretory pathway VirB2 component (pilin)